MLKIGLTGGIGSGKTTIARVFATLGVPVYDADSVAKKLMRADRLIKQVIISRFGDETYKNNEPDREFLASVVFNDPEKLKQLNAILHPATIRDSIEWFAGQSAPYAIKEAAIIFESNSRQYLDYVIGVWAPEAIRIERTMERSHITEAAVKKRMQQQMNEDEKMKLCDFVIDNSNTQSVLQQVYDLHLKLLEISAAKNIS